VYRPRYEEIMRGDPSEAVRWYELADLTHMFFDIIEERNLGSTLAQPVLNPIVGRFDDANPTHNAIIRLILLMEEMLMDSGVITSDSKMIIGRKRA
jgi:hypothetical protein